jgi:hypothetical protein
MNFEDFEEIYSQSQKFPRNENKKKLKDFKFFSSDKHKLNYDYHQFIEIALTPYQI